MEWCDCYIVVLIIGLVGIMIYQMADNFINCGSSLVDDSDNYLKKMPFLDDIIYQRPVASNRRGYDILNSYNKIGRAHV